jgi:hypothetical protein
MNQIVNQTSYQNNNIKKKSNTNSKRNFSPKTYFKEVLFDKVQTNYGRKTKAVSEEEFQILEFQEYDIILNKNFNVAQLKRMCRFYKQKVSGNKKELITRMYNFLKYSFFAISLQKVVRGWQRRRYFKLSGIKNIQQSTNDTDFLTLESINEIPYYQFFSYKDKDGFVYTFNIKSLYNLLLKTEGDLKNPYNRNEFPKNIIQNMRKFIKLSNIFKEPIHIQLKDETAEMSSKKKIALKTLSIFHRIDTFGHITDTSWFLSLGRSGLVRYIRELYDIWDYRANLSSQTKVSICPPTGNPFQGIHISSLQQKDEETIQRNLLYIMENMISRGTNKDTQALGAFYILAALTLVNHDAAVSLPWLYQSVAQH